MSRAIVMRVLTRAGWLRYLGAGIVYPRRWRVGVLACWRGRLATGGTRDLM